MTYYTKERERKNTLIHQQKKKTENQIATKQGDF